MGITRASGGEVRLFGAEGGKRRTSAVKLRQRIGYVAQEQSFYSWMTPTRLGRFLRGLYPTWDDAEYTRLLRDLDLPPNRKAGTFSGGMKVKLALALALAHRPELLVLDEPTAGLDPVARHEFLEMIKVQAGVSRRTTFFSTHLVDEVEAAAQRVGIVDGGRTLFEGTTAELAARVRRFEHPSVDPSAPLQPPQALVLEHEAGRLRVLRDELREGGRVLVVDALDPRLFEALAHQPEGLEGWTMASLPLEEVFIELVRRPWV